MTKIAGALLIVAATTLMGRKAAWEIEEEYRQMQYVQQLIYMLQSEIKYSRAYLGEAFLHIREWAKEPYRSWLGTMSRQMECKDQGLFSLIWERGISQYLGETKLPDEELRRLAELGGKLGTADMEMQLKTLELYQEQVALALSEKREGMRTKIRLCHCLGVMGGIFLTVLLA